MLAWLRLRRVSMQRKLHICAEGLLRSSNKPEDGSLLQRSSDDKHHEEIFAQTNGMPRLNLGPCACKHEIQIEIRLHWQLAICLWCEIKRSSRFKISFFCWIWREIHNSLLQSFGDVTVQYFTPKAISKSRQYMEIRYAITKRRQIFKKNGDFHMKIDLILLKSTLTEVYCIFPELKWGGLLLPLVIQKLNLEYVMACLSTLGGAHSSLGEHSKFHAKLAGMISVKQLAVAAKLDNPLLASHCRLYYAHSLIQTGKYKEAQKSIRREFRFAISSDGKSDPKLVTCCKAAWARVCYLQEQRKQRSQ